MKNVTVSVDDETYHRARVRAAEQRSSVSAVVREMLGKFAAEETEFERLKRRQQAVLARLKKRSARFSAGRRLSRDELHDRDALR
ncbi:ribbon-helix-helix protein, CopG family [Haloferula sp. A504]|uniref:ribbon-helix-helix protein, CopG family n=1 Tax=Haloferula sp. A504 TaxID=3373601 RepID=UPI0031C17212|nr:ribbon-helix-helix protein, CopG family [Verrucomicrobiaceae bacterium E54]